MIKNEQERVRIGQRIADLRKTIEWTDGQGIRRVGMTQEDLAVRCGLLRNNLSRIETGRYNVGFDTLQAIAETLGMTVDFISLAAEPRGTVKDNN